MRVDPKVLELFVQGDKAAADLLRPVIRKCVKAAVAKMPAAQGLIDDIEQELWLFLFRKVEKIDTQYNLEPYLISTARNLAMQSLESNDMLGERGIVLGSRLENPAPSEDSAGERDSQGRQGFASIDGREIDGVDVDIPEGSAFFEGLSRKNALEYLRRQSSTLRAIATRADDPDHGSEPASTDEAGSAEDVNMPNTASPTSKLPLFVRAGTPKLSDVSPPERRGPARMPPGQQHRHLREIRQKLGLSQIEMAKRLGIKLPTYQSYEYGKTMSVKDDVIERANLLLQDDDYQFIREKFAGKSMREIATNWAQRVGVDPSKVTEFARIMGVNKSTISRWLNQSPEPDVWELIRYEDIVERHEKRLKAVNA